METARPLAPRREASPRASVASRLGVTLGILTAVVGFAAVWGTWRVFVTTAEGQRVDQAAMDGAQFGRNRLWQIAEPILEIVSIPALAVVVLVAMTMAVLRRRWMLALQVAVLVAGANVTTQLLKNSLFYYPDLDVTYFHRNSLPSGHTTAAASVAAAAVLVVPPRARPWVAAFGAAYAGATGVSTLVGQWHRPSDVVAAMFVVLAWGGIAIAISALGTRGVSRAGREARPERTPGPGVRRFSTPAVVVVAGGYLLAALAGAGALTALEETRRASSLEGRTELLTAYAGGALGVVAATAAVFATVLVVRTLARPRGRAA